MKNKYFLTAILCVILCLMCSSCSYSEFEDKLHQRLEQTETEETKVIDEDYYKNLTMLGVGDTMEQYWELIYDDEITECGTKGLTYTLNNVEVYDSIYSAGIDVNDTEWDYDEKTEQTYQSNAFILADITAKYTAPEGEEKDIYTGMALMGWCDYSNLSKPIDEIISNRYKLAPYVMYFSNYPDGSDPNISIENGQYYVYRIKDGEAIDFKVGVIAAQEFVDSKNAMLILGTVEPEDTYTEDPGSRIFNLFQ